MTKFVKNRLQFVSPISGRWFKVNAKTGKLISVSSTKKPYKNVQVVEAYMGQHAGNTG